MALHGIIPCRILKATNKFGVPTTRNASFWSDIQMGPPDPIFGITEAYGKETSPHKINLGVGAYRNDDGKPQVLQCVRNAEEKIKAKKMNKEYLPMIGLPEFRKAAIELALGKDNPVLKDGLVAVTQSLSGTGALRMGSDFISTFHKGAKTIYVPNPTWGNHTAIFAINGFKIEKYAYYDSKTRTFDFKGCLDTINKIPQRTAIVFHAVAHNPTGLDPTREQWKEICSVVKKRDLLPFFDMAYQGFATGHVEEDPFSVRHFIKEGLQVLIAQSFSKNMGLYGERVGTLSIVTDTKESVAKIMSQFKSSVRAMYSNPPINGSRIVTEILTDQTLYKLWLKEVKEMANRIKEVRKKLRDSLEKNEKSSHNWEHITNQIGMFCYTGMNPKQVEEITKKHHVYLTKDGRISMAGVSSKNVDYLAKAINAVTK